MVAMYQYALKDCAHCINGRGIHVCPVILKKKPPPPCALTSRVKIPQQLSEARSKPRAEVKERNYMTESVTFLSSVVAMTANASISCPQVFRRRKFPDDLLRRAKRDRKSTRLNSSHMSIS